jgi:hypothetical protein
MPTFDNISLQPLLMADLYSESLVIVENLQSPTAPTSKKNVVSPPAQQPGLVTPHPVAVAAPPKAEPENIRFLGSFGKQVAVVVRQPQAVHMAEDELEFLNKILTAVKLSMADVAIINIEKQALTFPFQINGQAPQVLIVFGVEAAALQLPLVLPPFQVSKWHGCRWLFVPPVAHFLGTNPNLTPLKTQLWQALQQLFLQNNQ